jgi:hypothetical protein
MSLPTAVPRERLHLRCITLEGYKREDGLYDIEGHLHDTKDVDFTVAGQPRLAGSDVHSMRLRITVNRELQIVDAAATSLAVPYAGFCEAITPKYRELIGLSIRPGFTARVRELFGGVEGCTHITELIGAIATTAFQTMAGQGIQRGDRKPFQLDGCHALRTDGPAVAKFYPKWYRGEVISSGGPREGPPEA